MRLIDADALMKSIGCEDATKYGNKTAEQQHNSYSTMMMYEIADEIDDAPTIEAEPVRHGRWVKDGDFLICLNCESEINVKNSLGIENRKNYCPNCGAKMDGDVSDEG